MADAPIATDVRHTEVVDLDRALYGLSDADFARLVTNLRQDPFLGESTDGIRHEYLFRSLRVTYLVLHEKGLLLVLISGIRPSEGEKVADRSAIWRRAVDVLREFGELVRLFGTGK